MNRKWMHLPVMMMVASAGILFIVSCQKQKEEIEDPILTNQFAAIDPDYGGVVIPPNIAPLNFEIREKGIRFYVNIHSKQGNPIEIMSQTPRIIIPESRWRALLNVNAGESLYLDVRVKTENGQWVQYPAITNKIAREKIDGYLVYRKIPPVHNTWREMGLYQRNLQNYDESRFMENRTFKYGCCHCHAFCNNRTDRMSIGIRSRVFDSSLLLVEDGIASKVGLAFGFSAWHPSGRMLACSFNKPHLLIHAARNEIRDIVDLDSWIGCYFTDSKTLKTTPKLSRKDYFESYPAWSPDGGYLYFCSSPIPWADRNKIPVDFYTQVKFDLFRISYDIKRDRWGDLEPVFLAKETGLSVLQPRVSPDGRWLLFTMCEHGCWPIYQSNSDIYIADLKTARETGNYQYRKMEISTDQCESWHSWSSNSRWVVFNSKKGNPLFSRLYLAFVDTSGRIHKSLLVPQKDPAFYNSCLITYTIPELVTEPVPVRGENLARLIRDSRKFKPDLPITMATPKAMPDPSRPERE